MDWLLLAQETPEEVDRVAVLLGMFATPAGRASLSAVIFAVGLYLLIPPRGRGFQFVLGAGLSATALLLFLLPTLFRLPTAPVFFLLEGLALLGGLGTVTSRSPVYSAIWFASALLAIGALLLIFLESCSPVYSTQYTYYPISGREG